MIIDAQTVFVIVGIACIVAGALGFVATRAKLRKLGTPPTIRALPSYRADDPVHRPRPAMPWDDGDVIIDGAYGTPPLRRLEAFTKDVTPQDREE